MKSKIRRILSDRLSLTEIDIVIFDLGFDNDNYPAEKDSKIIDLLEDLVRLNRVDDLLAWVKTNRPDIDLSTLNADSSEHTMPSPSVAQPVSQTQSKRPFSIETVAIWVGIISGVVTVVAFLFQMLGAGTPTQNVEPPVQSITVESLVPEATRPAPTSTNEVQILPTNEPVALTPTANQFLLESGESQYINQLHEESIYRRLASPVGRLTHFRGGSKFTTTAWIISETHILSFYWDDAAPSGEFVLEMGRIGSDSVPVEFAVNPTPVEAHLDLYFAIYEVAGNPAETFGTISLDTRAPLQDESLFVIFQGPSQASALEISRYGDCRVIDNQFSDDTWIGHRCITPAGSSGAAIFAISDNRLLGFHAIGSAGENGAVKLSEMIQVSELMGDLLEE